MKTGKRIVALSVQGDRLTMVQSLQERGKVVAEKSISRPLPVGSVSEQSEAIKQHWLAAGFAKDECVVMFPMQEAIVKILSIPATNPAEVKEMLRLQAARLTPLAMEDITLVHSILETQADGYSRVMMVIVRREEVRRHLALFQDAGLSPTHVMLDAFTVLPYISQKLGGSGASESRRMIVEAHPHGVNMGIFRGAVLELLRCVPLPLSENGIEIEIQKTRSAYARSASEEIPVVLAPPVPLSEGMDFPGWAPWAGAMLDSVTRRAAPNLLPEAEQQRLSRATHREQASRTLIYALLCIGIFASAVFQRFHSRQAELERLTKAYASVASETKDLRRMERKIQAVQTQMSQEGTLLRFLAELNQNLASGVSLRAMDFDRGRSVTIQGNCFSLSETVRVVELLQKSGLFASVELRSSDVRRIQDRDVVEFTLACQVKHA